MRKDIRSDETRRELLSLLDELMLEHPDWRLGQMVGNIAFLARQTNSATYDVDDKEFLEAAKSHLEHMHRRHEVREEVRQLTAAVKQKTAA